MGQFQFSSLSPSFTNTVDQNQDYKKPGMPDKATNPQFNGSVHEHDTEFKMP